MEPIATKQVIDRFAHLGVLLPQSNTWKEALLSLLKPSELILDDVLADGIEPIKTLPLKLFPGRGPGEKLSEPFEVHFIPDIEKKSFEIRSFYHYGLALTLALSQNETGFCSIDVWDAPDSQLALEEKNSILLLSVLSVASELYAPKRPEENIAPLLETL